jgi:hypothetical protein
MKPMHAQNRFSLAVVLSAALIFASTASAVRADVIGTQQYITAVDRQATRQATLARIDSVLAREDVRKQLEHYGVDPAAANERVAALSDDELQSLANNLDGMPAGGSLLAVVGIVFIVLLILELVGVIDIFKKI